MLEDLFSQVEADVNVRLEAAKARGGRDDWENVCHEHIVNFLLLIPKEPFLASSLALTLNLNVHQTIT